jgi:hypothetical protein
LLRLLSLAFRKEAGQLFKQFLPNIPIKKELRNENYKVFPSWLQGAWGNKDKYT